MMTEVAKKHSLTLLFAAFVSGLCSIIYELLIATAASYFLGDSVLYFSLTIGIYMASMGVGTLLSKYIDKVRLRNFVQVELALAVIGGISVPALYAAYAYTEFFLAAYLGFTITIGLLIGLEIPFLARLMEAYYQLKINIANILSLDYFGALLATIAFPFLLLPLLGIYQSSLVFGLTNMSIAFAVLLMFKAELEEGYSYLMRLAALFTLFLLLMIGSSQFFLHHWDQSLYEDRIIYSKQSRYQRIILTKDRDDIRLYLDGNLQFSSIDEYRYHESLVHVPMAMRNAPVGRVLLLGAGDGLAVRELLKYPEIKQIVLVDLDPEVISLAKTNPYLRSLNETSMESEKLHIVVKDAFSYLMKEAQLFDLIICDLPDPNNNALARLYSKHFYKLIRQHLTPDGMIVTQATSPYFAPKAFWSIAKTMEAAGLKHLYPYHVSVPSFGEWGFVLAGVEALNKEHPKLTAKTRFLDQEMLQGLFTFSKDLLPSREVAVNELDKPVLLEYYLRGWHYYKH